MSLIHHCAHSFGQFFWSHIMRMKRPYHWDLCWMMGLFSPDVTFGNRSRSIGRCDFAPTDVTWRRCLYLSFRGSNYPDSECVKKTLRFSTNKAGWNISEHFDGSKTRKRSFFFHGYVCLPACKVPCVIFGHSASNRGFNVATITLNQEPVKVDSSRIVDPLRSWIRIASGSEILHQSIGSIW